MVLRNDPRISYETRGEKIIQHYIIMYQRITRTRITPLICFSASTAWVLGV